MDNVRTRFAPSPTGSMHVGNLRTAVYAYLLAKHSDGDFLLRIEDTDRERYVEDGVEKILDVLGWSGLEFDEGPHVGGDYGPYVQSERLDIYKKYAEELIDKDKAYYCFCTKEDLEKERAGNEQMMYSGKCRHLDMDEAKSRVAAGENHVIRLKVPKGEKVSFVDEVFGEIEFDTNTIDDQVLMKSDGFPTYHLAVVVDDHLMKITHIVRGNEWIPSVGKHILLYDFFGWPMPKHVHLPVITGADGKKLSKRKGDVFVHSYRSKGYLKETIVNFISLLGWNPGDNRELFTLEELVKEFSVERIKKSGAFFDIEKMNWMNKQYLSKMQAGEILERLVDIELNDRVKDLDKDFLMRIIEVEKSRMTTLTDINEIGSFYFEFNENDFDGDKVVFKKSSKEDTLKALEEIVKVLSQNDDWTSVDGLNKQLKGVVESLGLSNGDVYWPVRYCLSLADRSVSPPELLWVFGKEESLKRLELCLEKMK